MSSGICLAGEGAIARRHMDGLERIDGVEVVSLAGGDSADTVEFAAERGIPHWSLELDECLARPGVEAVILATPTPLHVAQAERVLRAGKHVLVEIPMAESLAESEHLVAVQAETGLTAMVCHTRRFNPSHQWLHRRLAAGELSLQHLVVETFFFRRTNLNALGKPRSWSDHLLWHHACHSVDLFQYQTGEIASEAWAQQGPAHPELGIAMDMSVGLRVPSGALCSLALSFNNDGPLGTFFRYICDNGHLRRALRRPRRRQRQPRGRLDGRRFAGRDRAPGPRVPERHRRGTRAERQCGAVLARHGYARSARPQPRELRPRGGVSAEVVQALGVLDQNAVAGLGVRSVEGQDVDEVAVVWHGSHVRMRPVGAPENPVRS